MGAEKEQLIANRRIMINVCGQQFIVSSSTLLKHPQTRLGLLATEKESQHFFESDPDIFKEILKFYWTDKLHCPRNICFEDFRSHLEFWDIDVSYISDCCSSGSDGEDIMEKHFAFFDQVIGPVASTEEPGCCLNLRNNIWCMLTLPGRKETKWKKASKFWAVFYLLVMIYTAILHSLFTMYSNQHLEQSSLINTTNNSSANGSCELFMTGPPDFEVLDYDTQRLLFSAFFTVEIVVRFICCPQKLKFLKSVNMLDAVIALFELTLMLCILVVKYALLPRGQVSELTCLVGIYWEDMIIILSTFRLFRLLSYATVYR